MPRNLLLALALTLAVAAAAQPTWRFHLAFEDGAGARDTIWMVYDTAATTGSDFNPQVDYSLGEGATPIDHTSFNVWTWNWDGDSTKTHAFPYSQYPIFDGTIIDAINWTPPMTIRWDTSLFHAPYLPYAQGSFGLAFLDGGYFFFHSNTGNETGYSILITDSAFVNEDLDYLFPIPVYFGPGDPLHVNSRKEQKGMAVFPNPAEKTIRLSGLQGNGSITIHDRLGRIVLTVGPISITSDTDIDISTLKPGFYFVQTNTPNTPTRHAKFQKME